MSAEARASALGRAAFAALILLCLPWQGQPFQGPKLILVLALGAAAWAAGLRAPSARLAPWAWRAAGALLLVGLIHIAQGPWRWQGLLAVALPAAGLGLYAFCASRPPAFFDALWSDWRRLALLQAVLAILQAARWHGLPTPLLPGGDDNPVVGTLGNPEFLAAFLAGAVILSWPAYGLPSPRRALQMALLLAAIALSGNKGSVALLGGLALWRLSGRLWAALLTGAALGAVALWLRPHSGEGRLFLWITSSFIVGQHPLWGWGPGRVEAAYLPTLDSLYAGFAGWAQRWGSSTATVRDLHNVFLQNWAELGLPGLACALLLVRSLAQRAWRGALAGAALGLFLLKMQYTVVLGAPTLLVCVAVLAAALAPREGVPAPRWLPVLALGLCAAALRPAAAEFWHSRGLRAIADARLPDAQADLDRAVAWHPGHSDAWLARAHVAFLQGRHGAMEADLRRCRAEGCTMNAWKISAHMEHYSGLDALALQGYERIRRCFPQHLTTLARLAEIYALRGDCARAREAAQACLDTEPRVSSAKDPQNQRKAAWILNACAPKPSKPRLAPPRSRP